MTGVTLSTQHTTDLCLAGCAGGGALVWPNIYQVPPELVSGLPEAIEHPEETEAAKQVKRLTRAHSSQEVSLQRNLGLGTLQSRSSDYTNLRV